MTKTGETGALSVSLFSAPVSPPARGVSDFRVLVRDVQGQPVEAVSLTVDVWMPAMGHGVQRPQATYEGDGVYLIEGVSLYMPGTWQLRATFSGAVDDRVSFDFDLP